MGTMKLDIYVNYKENCREAFHFYEKKLGGKIISMTTFGDMPGAGPIAEGREDKIIHALIEIGGTVLRGADIPGAEPMRSTYLTLLLDSVQEAEHVYALLAEGGEIFMKMEQTAFARRFAMLRDRFGTSWMLLHQD
jgi:PhnB protein